MSTPASLNMPQVDMILERLGRPSIPIFVPVRPLPGAEINDCFNVVSEIVKEAGGDMLIGWQIRHSPEIEMIEAEYHAVWQTADGKLIDPTPKASVETSILFVHDPAATYHGQQVSNIRLNLGTNLMVDHLIATMHGLFVIQNSGTLAEQHGVITLEGREATYFSILNEYHRMFVESIRLGATIDSKCFCGASLTYKDCHGEKLGVLLAELSNEYDVETDLSAFS